MKFGPFTYEKRWGTDGQHWTPYQTLAAIGRMRLHIFHRGDGDPDPHDHMWDFVTFPLTSYLEKVWDAPWRPEGEYRLVKAFRFHKRSADHTHLLIGRVRKASMMIRWHDEALSHAHRDPEMLVYQEDLDRSRCNVWFGWPNERVVTLCWVSKKKKRDWGFWKLSPYKDVRIFTQWRDYIYGDKK